MTSVRAARSPLTALRARVRATPVVLWILLAVAALHGTAWAFVTAPLNGPDEISHTAYVQLLAETGRGPDRGEGGGMMSTELYLLADRLYLLPIKGHPEGRPAWDRVDEVTRELDALSDEGRKSGTGPNAAATNPPLYYAYAAAAWKLSPDRSVLSRLLFTRLATVALMVLAVGLTWVLASELFSRPWQRVLATAVVALHPKLGHTAGQVNPDLMLVVMATGFLAAAVRIVNRGTTPWRLAALGGTAAGAVLTHPRGLFCLPAAALVLLVAAWRERPEWRRALRAAAGVGALLVGGLALAWLYTRAHSGGTGGFGGNAPQASGFNPKEFASYLWQFYFPGFNLFTADIGPDYGYRQVWIETFFGGFATFEIAFSPKAYDRLQIASFIGLLGLYTAAVIRRGTLLRRWPVVLVIAATFAAMMLQLHATSYSSLRDGGTEVVITGRYLLPAIALMGCAIAFTLGALPRRLGPPAAAVVVGLGVLLCLGGLGLTFARFHG